MTVNCATSRNAVVYCMQAVSCQHDCYEDASDSIELMAKCLVVI